MTKPKECTMARDNAPFLGEAGQSMVRDRIYLEQS